jgi:DNA-binding NarL/FixJ family response regulator
MNGLMSALAIAELPPTETRERPHGRASCIAGPQVPGHSQTAVAVVSPVPAFQRGLCAWLEETGFEATDDPSRIQAQPRSVDALLLTVGSDGDWETVSDLAQTDVLVLVLLQTPTAEGFARALRCGAVGVVAHDAPLEEITDSLNAALSGTVLLPLPIARALAEPATAAPAISLSSDETAWLRLIAQGVTLGSIASTAGYSERQMHRLLARLYSRMGVRGRSEALVLATRWGVVDDPSVGHSASNGQNAVNSLSYS